MLRKSGQYASEMGSGSNCDALWMSGLQSKMEKTYSTCICSVSFSNKFNSAKQFDNVF